MAEGFMTLFSQDDISGNKPHYRVLFKLDGVDHEAAFWPAKEGKKGFTGRYKPKEQRGQQAAPPSAAPRKPALDDQIPF